MSGVEKLVLHIQFLMEEQKRLKEYVKMIEFEMRELEKRIWRCPGCHGGIQRCCCGEEYE